MLPLSPSSRLRHLRLDRLDDTWLRKRTEVPELVSLSSDDLAHDTAHDLARASLGQVADDVHFLGGGEGADDFADLKGELFRQSGFVGGVVFEFSVYPKTDR